MDRNRFVGRRRRRGIVRRESSSNRMVTGRTVFGVHITAVRPLIVASLRRFERCSWWSYRFSLSRPSSITTATEQGPSPTTVVATRGSSITSFINGTLTRSGHQHLVTAVMLSVKLSCAQQSYLPGKQKQTKKKKKPINVRGFNL